MVMFDHPALSAWAADPDTRQAISFEADLQAMLRFEVELAAVQAELQIIPPEAADRIEAMVAEFQPDMESIGRATARDGVIVPGLVRQLRAALPDDETAHNLHLGATSQDVIDTALMLRLQGLLPGYVSRMDDIERRLQGLRTEWGDRPLMAVTWRRDALQMTVGDRIASWSAGLAAAQAQLIRVQEEDLAVQFAGPIGTLDAFGARGADLRAILAARLGLLDPGMSWHTERGRLLRIATALVATTAALGKIGADIGLMAQDGTGKVTLDGGSSSSMPHKVNPVDAELLVAQAAFAGGLLGMMGQAGVHASERDGAAWTLEWMVLPQTLDCAGGALRATDRLLCAIQDLG